jgi:hypothetical protein
MIMTRRTWIGPLAIAGIFFGACSDDGGGGSGGSDDTGTSDGTAGSSFTATQGMSSTSASTSGTTGADTGDSSADDTVGFVPRPDTPGMGPQPNGGMCMTNEDCVSMFCYQIPMLGGVCSECLVDEDCKTGTCGIDFNAMYAICMPGAMGDMCNTDEGCMGDLVCATVVDTGGIFDVQTCSECSDAAPCADGQVCSPHYDAANFGGWMECVEPGSVPNNEGCPLDDMGNGDDSVCMSGHCEPVDVMGFIQLGVCGECSTDMDCMMMQTCMPGTADQMTGLMGTTCG